MGSGKYQGQGQKGAKIVVGAPAQKLGKSAGKYGGLSGSKGSSKKKA